MLNFLQIRDYAIVESLDLEFSGGFTCVTGETGAGKSILVDALGLLRRNSTNQRKRVSPVGSKSSSGGASTTFWMYGSISCTSSGL